MGFKNKIKPSYVDFNHGKYRWKPNIDYRKNPHLYEIGRGQQGVLICQPYKSELHPLWRFKTPEEAQLSCNKIYLKYLDYLDNGDFVGCDMAKKYLHMGFTRSRRYWNHSSGKKWTKQKNGEWIILPLDRNEDRFYQSSLIFQRYWKMVREDRRYLDLKKNFKKSKKSS
tara:strand:+ start:382 stop:888 length:507 start_codon:yes stop_codon:yes gene_type:complete